MLEILVAFLEAKDYGMIWLQYQGLARFPYYLFAAKVM